MAELKTFDFTGAMGRGLQLGQTIRQQQNQGKLAALLGQARTTSGPQRDALMGQVYGVDPAAGMAAEQQMGKLDEIKAKRLGQMASIFTSVDPQQRAAMWPTIRQELSQIIPGAQYPDMWDESLLPQAQAIAEKLGSLSGNTVQSRFVAEDGRVLMVMRDGSIVDSGEKADRQMWFRDHPGMDPQLVGKDGMVRPVGGYAPQPQQAPQTQFTGGDGTPVQIDPNLPPQVQAAIRANEGQWAQVPDQSQANIQVPGQPTGLARPSEAQVAAEQEAAKRSVGLQFAGPEAQAEAERTRLIEGAKAEVGRQAEQPKARLSLEQATARMQRVDSLVDSILPRISAATSGFLGGKLAAIPGTPAHDLQRDLGTLQAIAGFDELNAMRAASPTGGALGNVTERELAFLQSVIRNIENSQSPDQLRRNVEQFRSEIKGTWRRVREAYEKDFGGEQQSQSDIDALLDMYR